MKAIVRTRNINPDVSANVRAAMSVAERVDDARMSGDPHTIMGALDAFASTLGLRLTRWHVSLPDPQEPARLTADFYVHL